MYYDPVGMCTCVSTSSSSTAVLVFCTSSSSCRRPSCSSSMSYRVGKISAIIQHVSNSSSPKPEASLCVPPAGFSSCHLLFPILTLISGAAPTEHIKHITTTCLIVSLYILYTDMQVKHVRCTCNCRLFLSSVSCLMLLESELLTSDSCCWSWLLAVVLDFRSSSSLATLCRSAST